MAASATAAGRSEARAEARAGARRRRGRRRRGRRRGRQWRGLTLVTEPFCLVVLDALRDVERRARCRRTRSQRQAPAGTIRCSSDHASSHRPSRGRAALMDRSHPARFEHADRLRQSRSRATFLDRSRPARCGCPTVFDFSRPPRAAHHHSSCPRRQGFHRLLKPSQPSMKNPLRVVLALVGVVLRGPNCDEDWREFWWRGFLRAHAFTHTRGSVDASVALPRASDDSDPFSDPTSGEAVPVRAWLVRSVVCPGPVWSLGPRVRRSC